MALKLVFEELDLVTGSVCRSTLFEADDVQALDDGFDFEFSSGALLVYDLTAAETVTIAEAFGLAIQTPGALARLSASIRPDALPYRIHANRELLMMLQGEKPFAAFAYKEGDITELGALSGQKFDAYVASGTLLRRDHVSTRGEFPINRIMFAVPGDEWRFDEYVALMDSIGWNDTKERREGELLGYTDEQNDAYLVWKKKA